LLEPIPYVSRGRKSCQMSDKCPREGMKGLGIDEAVILFCILYLHAFTNLFITGTNTLLYLPSFDLNREKDIEMLCLLYPVYEIVQSRAIPVA